jgi:pullulanase/glycogen debranching enzyme
MKPQIRRGYLCVDLNHNRNPNMVHRLVAETYIPNELNKTQVNHKNGIKNDNRLENLEWVSPQENTRHWHSLGLRIETEKHLNAVRENIKKSRVKNRKLTDDQVIQLRKDASEGLSHSKLKIKYGISQATISLIVNKKTYQHIL